MLELVTVLVEVGVKLRFRNRLGRRRVGSWTKSHEARGHAVVLIAPDAPEVRIVRIYACRDLIEQFLPWDIRAVVLLEAEEEVRLLRVGAREIPVVFVDVEPAVR